MEAVRMAKKKMWVSHEKAANALGYAPASPVTAFIDADLVFVGKGRDSLRHAQAGGTRDEVHAEGFGLCETRVNFIVSELIVETERVGEEGDASGVELLADALVVRSRGFETPLAEGFAFGLADGELFGGGASGRGAGYAIGRAGRGWLGGAGGSGLDVEIVEFDFADAAGGDGFDEVVNVVLPWNSGKVTEAVGDGAEVDTGDGGVESGCVSGERETHQDCFSELAT